MWPVLLSFGPFHLYGYGAAIAFGGVLAARPLWLHRAKMGLRDEESFWTLINLAVLSGFIGGKLMFLQLLPVGGALAAARLKFVGRFARIGIQGCRFAGGIAARAGVDPHGRAGPRQSRSGRGDRTLFGGTAISGARRAGAHRPHRDRDPSRSICRRDWKVC